MQLIAFDGLPQVPVGVPYSADGRPRALGQRVDIFQPPHMPIVPPATSLPLAPRPGTPCATHVCKLPSVTIQGGAVHVLKPNGTSTCSLGESLDLKHAADLKAPLDVSVWDDLPHSPARPVVPLTPAMLAGPCLSDLDMCTTDSCSSLGPEQPKYQASCAACACRAHPAAPCTILRTPTATRPSTLYENEAYFQPSDNLYLPPSRIGQVYIAQTVPLNGQPLWLELPQASPDSVLVLVIRRTIN